MKKITIILICIFLLQGCKNDQRKLEKDRGNAHLKLKIDTLELALSKIEKESPIAGFAVAIVNSDSVIYQKGFGISNLETNKPYSSKTIQPLASISKTFIGASIMILVDEGKLNLDESINDILPYKIVNPFFPNEDIKIRHLVTHTSTITDDYEDIDGSIYWLLEDSKIDQFESSKELKGRISYFKLGNPIELDEYITNICLPKSKWYSRDNFLNDKPGSRFEYSNLGASIAARIVEIKSGESFKQFTEKSIFQPLGMTNTGWFYEDVDSELLSNLYELDSLNKPIRFPRYHEAGYPEGQLKSNAEDMSKYLIEMIKGYSGNGSLLSNSSYKVLFTPQLNENHFDERSDYEFDDEYNLGVFWAISKAGLRLHNGAMDGVYSFLYLNPETNIAAIAFCNLPDNSFGEIRSEIRSFEKE